MPAAPLANQFVAAAAWPAAALAGRLLQALGAEPGPVAPGGVRGAAAGPAAPGAAPGSGSPGVAVALGATEVRAAPSTPADDWRASGVDALTGRPDGPALTPSGAPATLARALALSIHALGGASVDGAELLGLRVGLLPLRRGGDRSAGGAARLLRSADDWAALSLPRESDRSLVPALISDAADDPWEAVSRWARDIPAAAVVERAALLGLAVARLGERAAAEPPWTLSYRPADTPLSRVVVNLGALWAAPLCAQILRRSGYDVIDVESPRRPDVTPPELYGRLHDGHQRVVLDPATPDGRRRLAELLASAGVVLEASRPRALRQLGLDADRVQADGRRRIWVRITGHGPDSERIAFGDDAAVAGGLVARDEHGPVFAGDAIADPLTGLTAALLVLACERSPGSWVADVPMAGVAALAALTTAS